MIILIEFLTSSGDSTEQTGRLEVAPKNGPEYPGEKSARAKKCEMTLFVMRAQFRTTVLHFYRKVVLLI